MIAFLRHLMFALGHLCIGVCIIVPQKIMLYLLLSASLSDDISGQQGTLANKNYKTRCWNNVSWYYEIFISNFLHFFIVLCGATAEKKKKEEKGEKKSFCLRVIPYIISFQKTFVTIVTAKQTKRHIA